MSVKRLQMKRIKKSGFLVNLLGILGTILLGNKLACKGVFQAGE